MRDQNGSTAEKRDEWGVEELKGRELTDDQLWETCRYIRASGICALVQGTDNNAVKKKNIEQHRSIQAPRLHENLGTWREEKPFLSGTSESPKRTSSLDA
ncbi:MAG: hypothetical protein ABR579_02280 [Actinomycetota bacterium]